MITTNSQQNPTRRLTILYISSLAVVACLSIAGEAVVQRLLSQQQIDIQVISNVQHQQLLSQRLAKLALALKLTQDDANRQSLVDDFEQTIGEWETTEKKLEELGNTVNVSTGRNYSN